MRLVLIIHESSQMYLSPQHKNHTIIIIIIIIIIWIFIVMGSGWSHHFSLSNARNT